MKRKPAEPCPCGRPRSYADCCGRLHAGEVAGDAESLMRSRYCAYARGLENYLLASWHPDTRPASLGLAAGPQPKWLSLEVKSHSEEDDQAVVEFAAVYRLGGRAHRMQERSRFRRVNGRWLYLDGSEV